MSLPSPPPRPADPAAARRLAVSALAHAGLRPVADPVAVADSVINDNYRVETSRGPVFLRVHRKTRTPERLARELRMMAFAAGEGVPVVLPFADAGRDCWWRIEGRLVQVFPWVEGHTARRGAIDPATAATLGAMQGRVHAALVDYRDASLEVGSEATWDTDRSIAELSRVDDVIRYYPSPGAVRLRAQELLRFQLALLENGAARPCADFAGLPLQPVHGDYHERNVILGPEGAVLAVVDWERAALLPPAFDVLRALVFMLLFEGPLPDAYLAGYATHWRLRGADCRPAVEMWWQSQLHNTWAFTRTFIEGDPRPSVFFEENHAALLRLSDESFRDALATRLERIAAG